MQRRASSMGECLRLPLDSVRAGATRPLSSVAPAYSGGSPADCLGARIRRESAPQPRDMDKLRGRGDVYTDMEIAYETFLRRNTAHMELRLAATYTGIQVWCSPHLRQFPLLAAVRTATTVCTSRTSLRSARRSQDLDGLLEVSKSLVG